MPKLFALTVEVGDCFKVEKIRFRQGKLILPVSKQKWADVRIIGRETYDFVHTCQGVKSCKQPLSVPVWQVESIRPARTRENVWIADVSLSQQWQLTFLVFRQNNHYTLKIPPQVQFISKTLEAQILKQITAEIENL